MTNNNPNELLARAKAMIDCGDVSALHGLIEIHPALGRATNDDDPRPTHENTLLLYVTSWPGGRPNADAITRLLIDAGSDPLLRFNGEGETVLHWAASNDKDLEIVTALLNGGANINTTGGIICGGTPLMNAVTFGFDNVATLLVERGAWTDNIVIAAGLGRIRQIESWFGDDRRLLKDSIRVSPDDPVDEGAFLGQREVQTWTHRAVIAALMCEQYATVDGLVDQGFDIDLIPDEAGWSCLHHAAYSGSLPMAQYLVEKGANLNVREENNAAPANYGGAHGHPDVMNYLVDLGTTISLESVAAMGRLDIVMQQYASCEDRAKLLMRTIGNSTDIGKPVHPSIKRGRVAVARYLLQKEPGLHLKEVGGKTVLSVAKESDDQYWLSNVFSLLP